MSCQAVDALSQDTVVLSALWLILLSSDCSNISVMAWHPPLPAQS